MRRLCLGNIEDTPENTGTLTATILSRSFRAHEANARTECGDDYERKVSTCPAEPLASPSQAPGVAAPWPAEELPTPTGGLSQSDVMDVMKAAVPDIQRCVAQQRLEQPGVRGKLVIQFSVTDAGTVSNVQALTLADTPIAACIRGLARTWRFRTGSPDPIVFPFKF